ncbi:hypothetical protein ACIOG4_27875 [Streptomyces microflavus]|uniref:hypothetical protein n=1 Tax=Streptomyces microflavus TaxID=1919 RepID=UPI0037F3ECA3
MEPTRMDPTSLPPIAFAAPESEPLPHPDRFGAVTNVSGLIRPEGGLWCAPVTARSADGTVTGTAWTDWLANPDDPTGQPSIWAGDYTRFTTVEPLPESRICLIDTADDLDRLVAAFPRPEVHPMRDHAPDWEAMAAAGWDAVYVSAAGIAANQERHPMTGPSLARWDCSSVLWLRPAYRLSPA